MKYKSLSYLLLCLLIPLLSFSSNPYAIKLKSSTFSIEAHDGNLQLTNTIDEQAHSYAIVQFFATPDQYQKNILNENGLELLEFIPNTAFLCRLNKLTSKTLEELNIRAILPFKKSFKYSKFISSNNHPDWALRSNNKVALMIEPHLDVQESEFVSQLYANGVKVDYIDPSGNYFKVQVDRNLIATLAELQVVKFIDYIPAPPEKDDTPARSLHRGNLLDADHPMGRKYDGTGVSISIADDGAIGPHIDFTGRVTQFVTFDNGTHGDMTSGIAIGAGNLDPTIRGAAAGADLYYYNIGGYPHISNAVTNLTNRGVVITSTSYSEGCNAGYTSTTRTVDQQTRQNPELLHVFSAGNSAGSTCGQNAYGAGTPWGTITGGRKQGKAVIATGNLDYTGNLTNSSSRGPAADGRIKPDICSNGTNRVSTDPNNQYSPGGGTSAAAPGIAGIAAQLYQGYRSLNSNNDPESGLIKSIMLNTTRNLGFQGPDFYYGWGRVNAHRAMKLIEENRFTDSTVNTNDTIVHTVNVPNDLLELRFMVYWTDYEASTIAAQALVNDIDMKVVTPNGDTIFPWILDPTPNQTNLIAAATRGIDTLNNMEQVLIDSAKSGNYKILVNGTSIPQGPQKYFLSWETKADEIEVTYPNGGESLEPSKLEVIRWDATGSNGGFLIEYSTDSGSTWNSIGTTPGSIRYRNWFVPASITGNAMVKVSRIIGLNTYGISDSSDYTFSIIETPENIRSTFVCLDSIGISWDTVPGATSYEISMLGSKYMDSIGRADTNYFEINNTDFTEDNWVSVKALGPGIIGQRANAVLLSKLIDNCNFNVDFGIEQLYSPNGSYVFSCGNNKLPVTIQVKNNGNSSISSIPVEFTLNNLRYRDTINATIASDSSFVFTFKDSINANLTGLNNFEVNGSINGDENYTNDSIVNEFEVFTTTSASLPIIYDFDNTFNCPTTFNCGSTNCALTGGWINVNSTFHDDFDMRVNNGSTPSGTTGPANDHTLGNSNGKYIYSEASNGCYEVESHVVSPCINLAGTSQPELSFWYHMFGNDVGTLSVDIYSSKGWESEIIPAISGNQGNSWLNEKVDLSNYIGETINLRFRIKTGDDFSSDIAIDDIEIEDLSTSIEKVSAIAQFKIFPNPAKNEFNLQLSEIPEGSVSIYDMNGRIVKQVRPRSKNTRISIAELDAGIYFVTIDNSEVREKLIVY